MMFQVYEEETKKRLVDEALKGERGVNAIADEASVARITLRKWLRDHYAENPDDPRRHLVMRESSNYERELALEDDDEGESEDAGADDEAREDMAAKKTGKKRQTYGKGNPHPKKAEILKELEKGEKSQSELGRIHGISAATISSWSRARDADSVKAERIAKAKAAVLEDIKAGYIGNSLVKRHKKHLAKSAIYRMLGEYRDQQESAGQRALPGVETTLVSRPAPSQRVSLPQAPQSAPPSAVGVVRYEAQFSPDSQMMGDTLAECIEERQTLRGMVTLQQRELDNYKRQLAAYQRTFGEIRR